MSQCRGHYINSIKTNKIFNNKIFLLYINYVYVNKFTMHGS